MFCCIVVGSRSFNSYDLLSQKLDRILSKQSDVCIVSGGARGADALAERYARERGHQLRVFPADWARFGRSAGYRRNNAMHQFARQFDARGCVCFWDGQSRGTQHSFELARQFGTPLRVIKF